MLCAGFAGPPPASPAAPVRDRCPASAGSSWSGACAQCASRSATRTPLRLCRRAPHARRHPATAPTAPADARRFRTRTHSGVRHAACAISLAASPGPSGNTTPPAARHRRPARRSAGRASPETICPIRLARDVEQKNEDVTMSAIAAFKFNAYYQMPLSIKRSQVTSHSPLQPPTSLLAISAQNPGRTSGKLKTQTCIKSMGEALVCLC